MIFSLNQQLRNIIKCSDNQCGMEIPICPFCELELVYVGNSYVGYASYECPSQHKEDFNFRICNSMFLGFPYVDECFYDTLSISKFECRVCFYGNDVKQISSNVFVLPISTFSTENTVEWLNKLKTIISYI
jgi:hypothetical protein